MKIIEEGKKVYECRDCGCKFMLTSEEDINRYDTVLIEFGFLLPHYEKVPCQSVKCPQCGKKIVIKY